MDLPPEIAVLAPLIKKLARKFGATIQQVSPAQQTAYFAKFTAEANGPIGEVGTDLAVVTCVVEGKPIVALILSPAPPKLLPPEKST